MAIINNLETSQFGVGFNNAYYRINEVVNQRNEAYVPEGQPLHLVFVFVKVYAQKPENVGIKEVATLTFKTSLDEISAHGGDNFLTSCYLWLMTRPEFQDGMPG